MRTADEGIERLKEFVDTLIVIPNQNLFRIANEKTTFAKAFEMADEVLYAGVRGVTDLMVMPGLINLDFADVRTVMSEMGTAMMGMGEAEGERRAVEAAEAAISNPLLDVSSMKGARGVLINITGGMDLTLYEVDEAANKIRAEVDPEANIIVGSTFDERLNGRMRVSVVATGISAEMRMQTLPAKVSAAVSKASGVRSTSMPTFAQPIVAGSTNPASSTGASPVPAPSHPVHSMQSEIVRAGLAGDAGLSTQEHSVCAPPQRGYGGVESHIFDPEMIESVGAALRGGQFSDVAPQRSQRPPLPPQFQQETKKSGGFSVFGISIGGTSSAKRNPISKPGSTPSGMRLAPQGYASESSRSLPVASKSSNLGQDKSDEPFNAVSDDQLEIPAFLRRQVN